MLSRRSVRCLATLVTLTVLFGCASLPPAKPATDLKAIAGRWEGTIQLRSGSYAFTSTIREDGITETIIPAASNPGPRFTGLVTVENGRYRWKSETTGRTGTYTLHESNGRRVLVGRSDDGASATEAIPAQ